MGRYLGKLRRFLGRAWRYLKRRGRQCLRARQGFFSGLWLSIASSTLLTWHSLIYVVYWLRLECPRFRFRGRPERVVPGDVLLLAWSFPPTVNGGVYRPTAFVRHLPELGWTPRVAAGQHASYESPGGEELRAEIDPSTEVHRFSASEVPYYEGLFPTLDGGTITMLDWVQQLRIWIQRGRSPSVIVATGPPFHSFVAARYLARIFRCKLVLDYRDEWTECPFLFVQTGWLDRWFERRCLAAADAVVFTTQAALEHQREVFAPAKHSHWRVIANGWEESEHSASEPPVSRGRGDVLRLSFVGNLHDHTLPKAFLQTVEDLLLTQPQWRDRLRICFVGYVGPTAQSQLDEFPFPDILELTPMVPRAEAHGLMRQATALCLFNLPNFDRYLPGKLFDYLASGRPVMVFGERTGEIPRLVQRLDAGHVVIDCAELAAALSQLESLGTDGSEPNPALQAWLTDHTRKRMAERFATLLNELSPAPVE